MKKGIIKNGPVVYWMSRDQRATDNWALLYAQEIAAKRKVPLLVVFCLVPKFLNAAIRQYDFMLKGLAELSDKLKQLNIPFFLLAGVPESEISRFVIKNNVSILVRDFDPLRQGQE